MPTTFPLDKDVVFMQNYAARVNAVVTSAQQNAYSTGVNHGFNLTANAVMQLIAEQQPITVEALLAKVSELQAQLHADTSQ